MYHLLYLFGSILGDLIGRALVGQVTAFPERVSLDLWVLLLLAAIAAGIVVICVIWSFWLRYSSLDQRVAQKINVATAECFRNFNRDLGRAQTGTEVGEAIKKFSECWRSLGDTYTPTR
jgi:hypothetical protein